MKRNYKFIIPIILLTGVLLSFNFRYQPDPDKDKELVKVLRYILTQGHYQPTQIDNSFSVAVFNDFIEILDPSKHYFLQKDIDEFSKFKENIDDQILQDDLTFFYTVFKKYDQRVQESKVYYTQILANPLDITKDETYSVDYKNTTYATNQAELIRVWNKQLKMRFISRLYDKELAEKDKVKEDSTYVLKDFKILSEEALEKTKENMDDLYERLDELNQDDWFGYFINSLTAQFGPHSNYLSPKIKKRFDISMSGKLEGIGARLMKEGEYTKITELISGGPAWRAGELEVGDIILKVAQADKEPLDIVGMRLDDAIEFIKGKKGTEVRLTLKKVDGTIDVISIIRDVVELEETFVKSAIVEKDGKKYGVINLPKFYIDFNEKNYRNSATDMKKELSYLKQEKVEGVLIDLRDNGGGSLKTAIEIAGLFIDHGPVVQVKYRGEKANIRSDVQKGLEWEGPLVVMVNELSASASEIFAAAMQDYKRAIIIGGNQTFGKGTVQNFYELNQYSRSDKDLGYLKMTIQKFYRINGGSTQLRGVVPDVVVPTRYAYLKVGERDLEKPMEWDKINSTEYTTWNNYENYLTTIQNSRKRVFEDAHFQLIDKHAKWLKASQDDKIVYLKYTDFVKDIESHDEDAKKFDKLDSYTNYLSFDSPLYEKSLIESDSLLGKKREVWHKNMTKDSYLMEGINVLEELKLKPNNELVKS
jgi:carboxyl-terminal processing protease